MALRLFGRFPFITGLVAGALIAAIAGAALIRKGVIGTEGFHTRLAPQLYIFDRRGQSDQTLWESIQPPSKHHFESAQDVYFETGYVRIGYAGSAGAPMTFVPKPLGSAGPKTLKWPQADPSFRPGPAFLKTPNNQEGYLTLSPGGTRQKVVLIGTLHGVAWEGIAPPDRRRIDLFTFTGPWALRGPVAIITRGSEVSGVRSFTIPTGYPRALSVGGGPGVVVVSTKPMRFVLDGRGPGVSKQLYLEPMTRRFRVYVGLVPGRSTPTTRSVLGPNLITGLHSEAQTALSRFSEF